MHMQDLHGDAQQRYHGIKIAGGGHIWFYPVVKSLIALALLSEKKPWLLPFYYIVRLFTKLKYNAKSAKKELEEIKKIEK